MRIGGNFHIPQGTTAMGEAQNEGGGSEFYDGPLEFEEEADYEEPRVELAPEEVAERRRFAMARLSEVFGGPPPQKKYVQKVRCAFI